INSTIVMNKLVPCVDHLPPWYLWMLILKILWNGTRCFTDDLKIVGESLIAILSPNEDLMQVDARFLRHRLTFSF
ncbi:MAG TPA: hypothetical protein VEL31_08375, partial [Ktedonobacteraceae bacterium]|nr:hypothetical protein [Ktedonobacteraceae bacterium]